MPSFIVLDFIPDRVPADLADILYWKVWFSLASYITNTSNEHWCVDTGQGCPALAKWKKGLEYSQALRCTVGSRKNKRQMGI